MSKPTEATRHHHNSRKLSTLLPLRAIQNHSFQNETPCIKLYRTNLGLVLVSDLNQNCGFGPTILCCYGMSNVRETFGPNCITFQNRTVDCQLNLKYKLDFLKVEIFSVLTVFTAVLFWVFTITSFWSGTFVSQKILNDQILTFFILQHYAGSLIFMM